MNKVFTIRSFIENVHNWKGDKDLKDKCGQMFKWQTDREMVMSDKNDEKSHQMFISWFSVSITFSTIAFRHCLKKITCQKVTFKVSVAFVNSAAHIVAYLCTSDPLSNLFGHVLPQRPAKPAWNWPATNPYNSSYFQMSTKCICQVCQGE